MISLGDMRPAWRRPAGAQQRRLPLWHKRLAEIIDLAKNLDDPIQHHRLRHSAMTAYLKKLFRHNPLVARKPLIRVPISFTSISRACQRWPVPPLMAVPGPFGAVAPEIISVDDARPALQPVRVTGYALSAGSAGMSRRVKGRPHRLKLRQ